MSRQRMSIGRAFVAGRYAEAAALLEAAHEQPPTPTQSICYDSPRLDRRLGEFTDSLLPLDSAKADREGNGRSKHREAAAAAGSGSAAMALGEFDAARTCCSPGVRDNRRPRRRAARGALLDGNLARLSGDDEPRVQRTKRHRPRRCNIVAARRSAGKRSSTRRRLGRRHRRRAYASRAAAIIADLPVDHRRWFLEMHLALTDCTHDRRSRVLPTSPRCRPRMRISQSARAIARELQVIRVHDR